MSILILAARGSEDPRSAANARVVAARLERMRPDLDVRPAFLSCCAPTLAEVLGRLPNDRQSVVIPFLLARAYYAVRDIPQQIERAGALGVLRADVLGEDDRLLSVLNERLANLDVSPFDQDLGVLLVATGSSNSAVNARTAAVAAKLSVGTKWVGATMAFATGPEPSVAEAATQLQHRGARHLVIAPWFLGPGRLTDRIYDYAHANRIPMAPPLGAHRLVAETVLDRYEQALADHAAA